MTTNKDTAGQWYQAMHVVDEGMVVPIPGPPGPPGDATNATYSAPGSPYPITMKEKFDEIVSVTGWMPAPYDPAADHTDWLNGVIDSVHAELGGAPVGILLPHPVYNLSDTLAIPYDHMTLIGRGMGDKKGAIGSTRNAAATRISATSSFPTTAGKALVRWQPLEGAAYGVMGGGLSNLMLDGDIYAARCLAVLSCHRQFFDRIMFIGGTASQTYLGNVPEGFILDPPVGGDRSTRHQTWNRCYWTTDFPPWNTAPPDPPGPVYETTCLKIWGENGANVNRNRFVYCSFNSLKAHAVVWGDSDSNQFFSCVMASQIADADQDDPTWPKIDPGPGPSTGRGLGIFGLELCSSTQTSQGVARNSELIGCQIKNTVARACQAAVVVGTKTYDSSPYNMNVYANSDDNEGGAWFPEIPGAGLHYPHYIIHDKSGITVNGHGKGGLDRYELKGVDRIWLIDGVPAPLAAMTGYAQTFVDAADGDYKILFGNGTLKTLATNP